MKEEKQYVFFGRGDDQRFLKVDENGFVYLSDENPSEVSDEWYGK